MHSADVASLGMVFAPLPADTAAMTPSFAIGSGVPAGSMSIDLIALPLKTRT